MTHGHAVIVTMTVAQAMRMMMAHLGKVLMVLMAKVMGRDEDDLVVSTVPATDVLGICGVRQ